MTRSSSTKPTSTIGRPTKADASPAKWDGLLGEYGPDFNTLIILEKDGQLYTLIEWQYLYPLKEISENVFQFPDWGLYMGDTVVFTRDKDGSRPKSRGQQPCSNAGHCPTRRDVQDRGSAARR